MGFKAGNILEPAMGVGNFFGLLPEAMKSSNLYGIELDSITGRIAKQLYPQADITVAGFETTDRRDFFDLAIGNVPFGQYQVNDRAYNKLGFSSTTTFSQNLSTRCVLAAWWLSSLPATQWISSPQKSENISHSGRSCWEPSGCPTTLSAPTPERMLFPTLSFSKNVTAPSTLSRTGCIWGRTTRLWHKQLFLTTGMILDADLRKHQYGMQDFTVEAD
jgi:hypothetical protein